MSDKNLYKVVMYNETNHSLYTLSETKKTKISKQYIAETYFNKSKSLFKRIFNNNIIMYDDIVGQLIDYHREIGNDNYVEALSSHIFHNKIIMCYDDLVKKGRKNEQFPWDYNSLLYSMFLNADMKVSQQVIFLSEDQFNNDINTDSYTYNLFYDDVKSLVEICSECADEFNRKQEYNELIESAENKVTYKYPRSIKIQMCENKTFNIIDLNQVADWVENVMFDDNYYSEHQTLKAKDHNNTELVIQNKKGAMYIGDPNTGEINVYLSNPDSYKYKS